MNNRDVILNELEAISPILAGMGEGNVYVVPAAYFDQFPVEMMEKIKAEELLAEAKGNSFTVPKGYFDQLAGSVLLKIKGQSQTHTEVFEELEAIAPLLNTIDKRNVFSVPVGYFSKLAINLQKANRPAGKVISMTRKWVSYAAAAVMAGVLVTGAFLYTDKSSNFEKELNKLSDEEVINYVDNVTSPVANLDDATSLAGQEFPSVKDHLQTVSDDELKEYLKENGEEVETASDGS